MPGDDRVDVGADAVDDVAERRGRVVVHRGAVGAGGALVHQHHDEVGAVGRQVGGRGVDLVDDVGDVDVRDAGRRDQAGSSSVTAPTKPTVDAAEVLGPGRGERVARRRPSGAGWRRCTPSRRRSCTRSLRSSKPWSSSWLPTAETSRPASLSASMVGSSCWMNDSNVEAPIRSPAATNTVFGVLGAQLLDRAGRARPRRPALPVVVDQPAVEVVGGEDLDLDRIGAA